MKIRYAENVYNIYIYIYIYIYIMYMCVFTFRGALYFLNNLSKITLF